MDISMKRLLLKPCDKWQEENVKNAFGLVFVNRNVILHFVISCRTF